MRGAGERRRRRLGKPLQKGKRAMKSVSRTLSLVCLLLSYHALALSQTASTVALTGIVIDSAGAVVADAQVKVINEATKEARAVASQSNGSYSVPLLPPGAYRIEFSNAGFKSAVKTGLQVNVTETARL